MNRQEKSVWIEFGMFFFKTKKFKAARAIMKRSFDSLMKKDHLDVISKFAQMEFKMASTERGKSLFESILVNYPKRIDIWLIYLSMLIKFGLKHSRLDDIHDEDSDDEHKSAPQPKDDKDLIVSIRSVFERVVNMGLALKKVNPIFKKYIEFEQIYGTESTVNRVKQRIVDYVETNQMLLTS